MRFSGLIPTIFLSVYINTAIGQVSKNDQSLPNVEIKTVDGQNFQTSQIENDGNPIVINFWATWCRPCVKELTTIAAKYEDWQQKTKVKVIAISIDDAKNLAKVAPFVKGKGWDYEVYVDPDGNLKQAMNVSAVPHTFLLNGDLEVVYSHSSYAPGDEEVLFEKILGLTGK